MIAPMPARRRSRRDVLISVVLPVYNEAGILRELTRQLLEVLTAQTARFEIVYVNDGSSDDTRVLLDDVSADDPRIVVVHLARNFGHQPAVHAGLAHASGDAVIVMDSDLQDDPRAIPSFLERWEEGFDVVYAVRFNRKEALPKRALFYTFYRLLNWMSGIAIPQDAGNFGLLDRRVADAMLRLPERDRYFPGLRSWAGFRQTGVPVERAARHDSRPRVSLRGLIRLAKTAIFSFSTFPLTFFFIIAAISATVCIGATGFVLFHKLFTDLAVPGWSSTIITASFFGSLNALGISILGEYVIRIHDQVLNRPVYLTDCTRNYRDRPAVPDAPVRAEAPPASVALLLESLQNDFRRTAASLQSSKAGSTQPLKRQLPQEIE